MDQGQLDANLKGIRQLLSHLHGEVTALETSYSQVLQVLRKLEGDASTDDLSGLYRRRTFFDMWDSMLKECEKMNENCGMLLIDIDHFKIINDTHGHQTGDEVIQRVAGLVKQFETPRCFTGRYGGEEFAVAVKGTDAEILGLAEMMRRGVERLYGAVAGTDGKVQWKCTISIGMSSAAKDGFDSEKLIKAADEALYEAKRRGRNQVRAA
ncbi:MAG: GGDEF domain-containing protein [Cryobacterium sp.]|nr:GGDEF domain-containing protein [Oligoflexia bacterium]